MNEMNPVVHFELPYEDKVRMVDFYTKAFGWKPNILGPEMANYVVAETSERDEVTQLPKKPGMINGGMFERSPNNQHPSLVMGVSNIKEAMKRIIDAGGTIIGEPMMIPGNGEFISFIDTEGNRGSIIQPIAM
jgi:predicted enzyme related to lactoylglutathione lyase